MKCSETQANAANKFPIGVKRMKQPLRSTTGISYYIACQMLKKIQRDSFAMSVNEMYICNGVHTTEFCGYTHT